MYDPTLCVRVHIRIVAVPCEAEGYEALASVEHGQDFVVVPEQAVRGADARVQGHVGEDDDALLRPTCRRRR